MALPMDDFRAGMRRLAAGVCLITTAADSDSAATGDWGGMTATAVCSVSADPPTLLCCINRTAATYAAIRANGRFGVNVLSVLDQHLADHFASRRTPVEKFAEGLWTCAPDGAPLLESAMAAFDCRVAQAAELGTRGVVFGEIHTVRVRKSDTKPLLYAHGAYGGFASMQAVRGAELLWIPEWISEVD
jgi:flavin reductase (DIM6/NTAB) family NADH-FMN oxidoreductase RutF